MSTSENLKWARCPICFDSVNERQLKCVKWHDGPSQTDEDSDETQAETSSSATVLDYAYASAPRTGSTMRMRLMQRPQITTLALPRSHTWPSDILPPHQAPFHFLPDVYNYAKFMLATPSYLIADLNKDLDELAIERKMLSSMQDELGILFVDAAEIKLRHQIEKAAALETPQLKETVDKALRDQSEIEARFARLNGRNKGKAIGTAPSDVPDAFLAVQSVPIGTHSSAINSFKITANPTIANNRNQRQRRNLNPPPPSTQTYYYYQAASGLPLFFHPLDIKILFSHFNNYASFPNTITVRVEAFTEGTVNDDLRKRCKYLAHMPEGADVVFIEADLEGVVGQEGLKNFEGALKTRKSRRNEKGRKDDRAKARAEQRDKEREWVTAPTTPSAFWSDVVPPTLHRPSSPAGMEDISAPETIPQPQATGAWGTRSFASAAHSAPLQGRIISASRPVRQAEEDFDIDAVWHDLEQRSSGGRRKRGNKLVVLGGGGGRRR